MIDAICEAEGIRYRKIETPLSNTNAVFFLDLRVVVKIYSPFWSEFEMESKLVEALGTKGFVPVPKILAMGHFQDRVLWNYLVLEYIPGLSLDSLRTEITREDLLIIATQVGEVVKELHQTPVGLLDSLDAVAYWDNYVDQRRTRVLTELVDRGMIGRAVAETLSRILESALAESERRERVVVHGDLGADNILFKRIEGKWRVAALIDFGDAKIDVRDYEWMPLWLNLFDRDIEAMQAFVAAYDPSLLRDDEFPRRVMAWTLLHLYSADAVAELLQKTGTPTPVETVDGLHDVLWPGLNSLLKTNATDDETPGAPRS